MVGRVTCGTTWHAAGLTAVLGGGVAQVRMLQYAIDLFPQLEKETGMGTGELFAQSRLVTQLDRSTPEASIIPFNELNVHKCDRSNFVMKCEIIKHSDCC